MDRFSTLVLLALSLASYANAQASLQPGQLAERQPLGGDVEVVREEWLISRATPGLQGVLEMNDRFGRSIAPLGDLDGDGVLDIAVGATPTTIADAVGEVYILFMNADGTVKDHRTIGEEEMGFVDFEANPTFGTCLANLGDRDGDGVPELAVGSPLEFVSRGSVWILFLNADGTLKSRHKIASQTGGFDFTLDNGDSFGDALANIGDLDGDGNDDLAVGTPNDDDGGTARGCVWILFLDDDVTVRSARKLSQTSPGGFGPGNGGKLGESLATLEDLDGDGLRELAVSAPTNNSVGHATVWIVFLRSDGSIRTKTRISTSHVGAAFGDGFGSALVSLGDLDGDGIGDIGIGAAGDDHGSPSWACPGALWIVYLEADGSVREATKIAQRGLGGFDGILGARDKFGLVIGNIGDWTGNGIPEIALGTIYSWLSTGSVWILSLDGVAHQGFERVLDSITPSENGQVIEPRGLEPRPLWIEGDPTFGPSAALFDSDPHGPNAHSSDPDLLVDLGHVLILQENGALAGPNVYVEPDDDRFGGSFTLNFVESGVEPLSIDLIDLCPSPGQDVQVRLFDTMSRTRTFTVASGWTSDPTLDRAFGYRTLDLTTLLPQEGYVAQALASEEANFDAMHVVRIEIAMSGSGAIDNLRYDPWPDERLQAVNGPSGPAPRGPR